MSKLLFILKYRDALYTDENYNYGGLSSGLLNSATFITEMLDELNIESKLVQVVDNNCIDKEVTEYKPTHVIIEAYWVVPEKFEILTKLHPNVKWIIRNHSEIPFLATEGIGIDWTLKYLNYPNVYVSANSPRALREMKIMAVASHGEKAKDRVIYLPNFYKEREKVEHEESKDSEYVDIGCFGAIRPLKNNLIQAVAAIEFAQKLGKKLRFHINGSRVENGGNNPLKNIRALFDNASDDYQLVEHTWMPHKSFIMLCAKMDIALCVSFTETFCIVAADCVSVNTPIVVSDEIVWASCLSKADSTDSRDIVKKMLFAYKNRHSGIVQWLNKRGLICNVNKAKKQWLTLFKY